MMGIKLSYFLAPVKEVVSYCLIDETIVEGQMQRVSTISMLTPITVSLEKIHVLLFSLVEVVKGPEV